MISKFKNFLFWNSINKDINTLLVKEVNWWRGDKYWMRFQSIWKNKNDVLNKIESVNKILNERYKWKATFFIDPSFEKWFWVSIVWKYNEIWASLRIIWDNNLDWNLKNINRNSTFLSFLWYDIIHEEEKEMLIEAIKEYIKK